MAWPRPGVPTSSQVSFGESQTFRPEKGFSKRKPTFGAGEIACILPEKKRKRTLRASPRGVVRGPWRGSLGAAALSGGTSQAAASLKHQQAGNGH